MGRVVAELGEEAAIAAVNRIRSGGVAGFFCREEFEVVVNPEGEVASREPEGHPDDETVGDALARRAAAVDDPAPARLAFRADDRDRLGEGLADETPVDESGADETRTDENRAAGSRAERVVDGEPAVDVAADPVTDRQVEELDAEGGAGPVFGGPVPPGADPGRDRFLTLLERRLEETSTTEADRGLRRSRHGGPDHDGGVEPTRSVAPAPSPAMPAPGPVSPSPIVGQPSAGGSIPPEESEARPAFWRRLDRTGDELASFLPAGSPLTAVVGPLAAATMVVHGLQSTADLASAAVIVLTDRAGIVSEPSWEIVRTGDRLVRRLGQSDGATVIVIDVPVDLPHWVAPLQRRLRSVGVGLFRYAVSGQPAGDDLERYRQGADVPYAIDLMSRVEPATVVSLVADRHPIISVAGIDLGPELLVALRRHATKVEQDPDSVRESKLESETGSGREANGESNGKSNGGSVIDG